MNKEENNNKGKKTTYVYNPIKSKFAEIESKIGCQHQCLLRNFIIGAHKAMERSLCLLTPANEMALVFDVI
jgi:hypothetical protein